MPSSVEAVVDTNVMLDIFSCHDLERAAEIFPVDGHELEYRKRRAGDSVLLAIHLNEISAQTVGLNEFITQLKTIVPKARAGTSMSSDFTTFCIWFVKDHLLPRWGDGLSTEQSDAQLRGNAADAELLRIALENNLPLITNEGVTKAGVIDQKLRLKAKERGARVFSPREFWEGRIDPCKAATAFLSRFVEQRPVYLEQRRQKVGEDKTSEVLDWIFRYYHGVLSAVVRAHPEPPPPQAASSDAITVAASS